MIRSGGSLDNVEYSQRATICTRSVHECVYIFVRIWHFVDNVPCIHCRKLTSGTKKYSSLVNTFYTCFSMKSMSHWKAPQSVKAIIIRRVTHSAMKLNGTLAGVVIIYKFKRVSHRVLRDGWEPIFCLGSVLPMVRLSVLLLHGISFNYVDHGYRLMKYGENSAINTGENLFF